MDILQGLYSKSGIVMQKVAEELLFVEKDERIPKIDELSKKYNAGRGTIQSVLKKMEESQCIELESRGHLGTFLRKKNVNMLLQYCGVNKIVGVMPLPYSKKYEGLATALHEEFSNLELPLHIAFMRGAAVRLSNVLEGRYDFALVSKYAAEEAISKNSELMILKEFGPSSYVSGHVLMFSEEATEIKDGMKIGIDSFSTDQQALTLVEAQGKQVEYVNLNYMHLLQHLKAKSIDAMVWNVDEIDDKSFHVVPLTTDEAKQMDQYMSDAVCVINKHNRQIQYLFNLISCKRITAVQQQVECGERIPKY
ncbi:GntR family transcriptional regulator YhfZ [Bacillus sp. sid0103]|uniref:GntR family transcriptional regulator YhfZ n=1 Tax=Bacillus sp. sid0103 TaxID=2856337 RepID=UPI00210B9B07|nr:GntR family transcriptional regulator YhfZ [Bacillus sp. sid0103]